MYGVGFDYKKQIEFVGLKLFFGQRFRIWAWYSHLIKN